ncbi:roadblock/LC7 domain-containing protein [Plantactinospora sp. KBS50]|uniref:roadblock/LC7 domain-containing protein n=1 Tax=Plantactinospora sp. KBS50 TaxID=2024580 RepID=UPI0012FD8CB3|nr:roadblock/LC7 domain-containing protein [Plantactinospora sp. KBS50]
MDAEAVLRRELQQLRQRRSDVAGSVLAGVDGLHITSDLSRINPEHVAAMAAAGAGLSGRFAETVGQGRLREFVVHGTDGYVICYPAGWQALLAVVTRPAVNLARLHPEGRALAHRLGGLVDSLWPPAPGTAAIPAPRPATELRTSRAARAPMLTSRSGLGARRRPPGRP